MLLSHTIIWIDRGYPKKLAYQYLEDLHSEFTKQYGHQVETAARPYAFIKFGEFPSMRCGLYSPGKQYIASIIAFLCVMTCPFQGQCGQPCTIQVMFPEYQLRVLKEDCCTPADTFIQRTKKLYVDTRTQRNINKLNEDLTEVHSIMTKNIQDVLGHGEKLDSKFSGTNSPQRDALCKASHACLGQACFQL